MDRTATLSVDEMGRASEEAATMLRLLAHPSRLLLLCHLVEAEASTVGELMARTDLGQAYVSQQLARLRAEGLVEARRSGREMRYRISDGRVIPVLEALYAVFCAGSVRT